MHRSMRIAGTGLLAILALAVPTRPLAAQSLPADVLAVLRNRVGRWEVRNEVLGADGGIDRTTTETQEARFIINDQIVEIRGFIDGREDYRSFLLFNPLIGKFVLTTVDRSNNKVDLLADHDSPGRFTSMPVPMPGGEAVIIRRIFDSVEPDHMGGYLEISRDGGASWRRIYNQSLHRVGGAGGLR